MVDRRQDVLRLQPQMIPTVRAKFETAVTQVNAALVGLNQRGYLPTPWLGDEVSREVADHYTSRALNGPDSSYQLLVSYRNELTRIHDTLQQMEDHYRRTEGDNAALWGSKA
jgi:hypothetical protein